MDPHAPNEFVASLLFDASHTAPRDPLGIFGFLVGNWVWTGTDYRDDGQTVPTKGKWLFEVVLNGKAIQDVFIFENPRAGESGQTFTEYGTTVRFPLADEDHWRAVFIGPMNKVIRVLEGSPAHGEFVFAGRDERGRLIHWVFSDIARTSFHWRGEYSSDAGKSWHVYEELDARRS